MFQHMMDTYKDYVNVINNIFQLNTNDISQIYSEIVKFMNDYCLNINAIAEIINCAAENNEKYLRGYWEVFKKLHEEYKLEFSEQRDYNDEFYALITKEYHTGWSLSFKKYEDKMVDEILDVYPPDSVMQYIMLDDFENFRTLDIKNYDGDVNGMKYIDWCSYYGSLNCFRFLRNNGAKISDETFRYSFHGKNPQIIHELLQENLKPDYFCMENAIIMHNTDVAIYLNSNFEIEIPDNLVMKYFNLPLFLYKLCISKNFDSCLSKSVYFGIPSLVEFIFSKGVSDHAKNSALHMAKEYGMKEIENFLIENGAQQKTFE